MSHPGLSIRVFNDPGYFVNSLVVAVQPGRPCWIIDPGLPPIAGEIRAYLDKTATRPTAILLTHAHGDHLAGVDALRAAYADLPLYSAREEWPMLSDPLQNLSGHFGSGVRVCTDNVQDLPPGTTLDLDGTTWQVLDTSGHSPGGRSFYCAEHKLAIVGDAIFAGSVGRTDFPHSDGDCLLRNLRAYILTLPDETELVPGHGPATTVGEERATNPYLV